MNRVICRFLIVIGFVSNLSIFLNENITAQNSSKKIIVVAGQSNALNWHSDAALLDTSSVDSLIAYYYHTGLPPTRSGTPINSTSGNKWTTLTYQTQNPYTAYNEHFFGPEMTLARSLYSEIPDLAVIKLAYAGTSLAVDWEKGKTSGNQLYSLMMAQIDTALNLLTKDGLEYEFEGFFWMQGESDAANSNYADNYSSNLENFIQDLRTDLNTPTMKFVLGRIGNSSSYPHKEHIRNVQVEVADDDSFAKWVDTDDLQLDTDKVHLLAGGVKMLGERMAEAWKSLDDVNVGNEDSAIDYKFRLMQNYPNPFNPTTSISFQLQKTALVQLKVYNVLGQEVAILVDSRMHTGNHAITFNASSLANGLYFYSLITTEQQLTKKMLLIK